MVLRNDVPDAESGPQGVSSECLEPDVAARFANGWLSGDELASVEAHIDRCVECRRYVSDLARTSAADDPALEGADADARTLIVDGVVPAGTPGATESTDPYLAPEADEVDEPPERLLPVGSTLGRYVVDGLLGSGGMGVVYAAFDPKLDRKVALKMVHTASAERPEARERLLREARAMARLNHPNVVAVYDVDVHDGQLFLAMEYVDGVTLRAWLRRASRPAREVLGAFVQAGRGLSAAHAVGVVHRDFKPDNVLVDRRGRASVTDFGLARATADAAAHGGPSSLRRVSMTGRASMAGILLGAPMTRTGVLMGTPGYMAPEQHLGKPADARSDQFAFCVALYEALYGQHPFEGPTLPALAEAVTGGKMREPPPHVAVLPRVQRALVRGLSADPAARFATMDELLASIEDEPRSRRVRAALAVGAALALGALGVGYRQARLAARPTCEGGERLVEGVWGPPRKGAVREAFLATGKPFAPDTWQRVERSLDLYTSDWSAARKDACEATHVRGEQSADLLDRRMACLDERLKEVGALADVFAHADVGVVSNATSAALALTPLAPCADRKALLSRARPALDPAKAARAEALRDVLGRSKALSDAGKYREALAAATEVAEGAEATGDGSLWAQGLHARGRLENRVGKAKEGEATLRRAASVADAAGDDVTRAQALTGLVFNLGSMQMNAALVPLVNEQAQAAIARLGGDPGLDGLRAGNFAVSLLRQGKPDEALREYQIALPQLERAFGPESRQVQGMLNGLGHALADRGDLDGAWAALRRAVDLGEATLGPHHPEVGAQLNHLGNVLNQQMRFAEAAEQFERVLAIEEDALGAEAPGLWIYAFNLGEALAHQGHHRRALPYLERSLALCEKLGQDYTDLLYPLSALGRLHLDLGERRKALTYLERAARLRSYPEAALDFAVAHFSLARALVESKRDRRRARALAISARDVYRASARSPLDRQTLQRIEQWLERNGRG